MKMWELTIICTMPITERHFFFKKETTQGLGFTFHCMANTKEEALQKAKDKYEGMNYYGTSLKLDKVNKITNWSEWTVEKAMRVLNGEQFAEYVKQHNLGCLFHPNN